jgi:hypothetical protein
MSTLQICRVLKLIHIGVMQPALSLAFRCEVATTSTLYCQEVLGV